MSTKNNWLTEEQLYQSSQFSWCFNYCCCAEVQQ